MAFPPAGPDTGIADGDVCSLRLIVVPLKRFDVRKCAVVVCAYDSGLDSWAVCGGDG